MVVIAVIFVKDLPLHPEALLDEGYDPNAAKDDGAELAETGQANKKEEQEEAATNGNGHVHESGNGDESAAAAAASSDALVEA